MNLTKFDVQELNAKEQLSVDGGNDIIPYVTNNHKGDGGVLGTMEEIAMTSMTMNWNLGAAAINWLFG